MDSPDPERPYVVAIGVSADGISALQTILASDSWQRSWGVAPRCP
jgi:chemotaxis response regulator CheB